MDYYKGYIVNIDKLKAQEILSNLLDGTKRNQVKWERNSNSKNDFFSYIKGTNYAFYISDTQYDSWKKLYIVRVPEDGEKLRGYDLDILWNFEENDIDVFVSPDAWKEFKQNIKNQCISIGFLDMVHKTFVEKDDDYLVKMKDLERAFKHGANFKKKS